MSFITPLGFLGLLTLGALLLIYLLKPNYQQKMVSTTFVWKLSLKYRKKRLPISKFRNILLLICQILILVLCAFLLAQPIIAANNDEGREEKIVIVDASASMTAAVDGETRFDRAKRQVKAFSQQVLSGGNKITVITAGSEAAMLARRAEAVEAGTLSSQLDELECSYGSADVSGAMALAETVLAENPNAEVIYYTGTKYADAGKVTVRDVSSADEWNAAILNVTTESDENAFVFTADVASYGRNAVLNVTFEAQTSMGPVRFFKQVACESDEVQSVVFHSRNEGDAVYDYESVSVRVESSLGVDAITSDNVFYVYGGTKPTIRVRYYAPDQRTFFSAALMSIRNTLQNRWSVNFIEAKTLDKEEDEADEVYDLYIYENAAPEMLPTDGVVLMVNPTASPKNGGFVLDTSNNGIVWSEMGFPLETGVSHPIGAYIQPQMVAVTMYRRMVMYDGFDAVFTCNGEPVFLAKNEPNAKIAVMPFSPNFSTLTVLPVFPMMMYNFFDYYLAPTLTEFVYDVNDAVELSARGAVLTVRGPDNAETDLDTFPADFVPAAPGNYTLTQEILSGETVREDFFVKIAAQESYITRVADSLANPFAGAPDRAKDTDLLVWFALSMVVLLFVEWLLQARDQF